MNSWTTRVGMALLAVIGAGLAAGCGSSQELLSEPLIYVMVDSKKNIEGTCAQFAPDDSRGQMSYEKTVIIRNAGTGVLCLKKLTFTTDNPMLTMKVSGAKPLNESSCPGAYAALDKNASLTLKVRYAPSATEENGAGASLAIEHNDYLNKAPVAACFTIGQVGPRLALDVLNDKFVNAQSSKPPEHCYPFGNTGTAPLIFKEAYFTTVNAQYSIISQPNNGDEIPAFGTPGNLKTDPGKLKVCVRYTPNSTEGDEDVKLAIKTNDPAAQNASITITATNEQGSYQLTCGAADGLVYDFRGAGVQATGKCNIYNVGPSGFAITGIDILAVKSADQDAAMGMYAWHLEKSGTTVSNPPYNVSKTLSIDIVVDYSKPAVGQPVAANLVIRFSQAGVPGTVVIPIIAGNCDTPDPAMGPQPQVWLQADVGETSQGVAVLANQSCAPLRIINSCIVDAKYTGDDACNLGSPSNHFAMVKPLKDFDVDPWGLIALPFTFKPQDGNMNQRDAVLHVVYCSGAWAADKCLGGDPTPVKLNLQGSIVIDLLQPTVSLGSTSDYVEAKVGFPLKIIASFAKGTHDDGQNYIWAVKKRPLASKLWLNENAQSSDGILTVVPDVVGSYTFLVMAQAFNAEDPGEYTWSPQSEVTVDVKVDAP
ncbi:MAG: hypothetical protein ACOYOB_01790 [Myxococcota bacterium]